tara:strand:- start:317 stop:592 length:276 start_codon:yes stop_codon:yes gene_type:complete
MATKNIIQQFLGLNMDEDERKYRMGLMENVKSPADFGQARPGSYGRGQYAAQDVPPVNIGNMPGLTLAQGQPQYANLMNIKNRLAPLYFRR